MSGLAGFSPMLTSPRTRAMQAMRVLGARPRRSSVVRSSSPHLERCSIPLRTQIGSAPHKPMRQPASISSPCCSMISSRVRLGVTAIRVSSGSTVTTGPAGRAAVRTAAVPPAAPALASRSAVETWMADRSAANCATYSVSLRNVRMTQRPAIARTDARSSSVISQAGGGAATSPANPACSNQ